MDYSVRKVGEGPLETTMILEGRYTRGVSGVMMSLSQCPRCRRRWKGEDRKTSNGAENPLRWRISLGTQRNLPKMPPPPGRRRIRSNRAGKSTAVEDFARYSVEDAQDAAAARKERDKKGCRCRGGGDKR